MLVVIITPCPHFHGVLVAPVTHATETIYLISYRSINLSRAVKQIAEGTFINDNITNKPQLLHTAYRTCIGNLIVNEW